MKFVLKLAIFFIILIPANSYALLCSNNDETKFQEMAKNITTTYDYIESNGNVTFNITFSNIPEGFIIKDKTNEIDYPYSNNEITLSGFKAGTSYRFDYYTNDILCQYDRLYTKYVNLPHYNPYYGDVICNGINYKYCNKWQKINMTYDQFVKDVSDYRKSLEIVENNERQIIKGFFDYIIEIYIRYYYIILPVFIGFAIFYIIYYNRKHDLF